MRNEATACPTATCYPEGRASGAQTAAQTGPLGWCTFRVLTLLANMLAQNVFHCRVSITYSSILNTEISGMFEFLERTRYK